MVSRRILVASSCRSVARWLGRMPVLAGVDETALSVVTVMCGGVPSNFSGLVSKIQNMAVFFTYSHGSNSIFRAAGINSDFFFADHSKRRGERRERDGDRQKKVCQFCFD